MENEDSEKLRLRHPPSILASVSSQKVGAFMPRAVLTTKGLSSVTQYNLAIVHVMLIHSYRLKIGLSEGILRRALAFSKASQGVKRQ
jgi:hypothetical protein